MSKGRIATTVLAAAALAAVSGGLAAPALAVPGSGHGKPAVMNVRLAPRPSADAKRAVIPAASGATRIINYHSAKCLEVAGWGTSNGNNVDQWSCLSGSSGPDANQLWTLDQVGTDQYGDPVVRVINAHSGKCAEVAGWGTGNKANVDQWTCLSGSSGPDTNQLWDIVPEPVNGGADYAFVNVHSGLVMEVYGQSQSNGANVDQWSWWGGHSQIWYF